MANIYDMADTWNNAGTTFTAIKMNVTDTASAAGSLLMDLQVGGVSKFNVDKTGKATAAALALQSGALWPELTRDGGTGGLILGFNSGNDAPVFISATDLALRRDAANILAQRNGVNAQASRLYFSFTDASNYTRLALKTATGIHTIEAESAGTGEANIDLALTPKGTGRVRFGTNTASGDVAISGYIEVKDSGGTVRKLATIT